jgi:hypothetical protein
MLYIAGQFYGKEMKFMKQDIIFIISYIYAFVWEA